MSSVYCLTFSYLNMQQIDIDMQPYGFFFKFRSVKRKGSKVKKLTEHVHCTRYFMYIL